MCCPLHSYLRNLPHPLRRRSRQAKKELTIEDIFQPGGILGRGPEDVKWSPDGTKVSFVQRDDSGEHGELYYVDVATGKSAVLVASEQAGVAGSAHQLHQGRTQEGSGDSVIRIAAYHWSPDSKKLLFDSMGQLWLYTLDTGTAVQITSSSDDSVDPQFSPDGNRISYVRKHNLYVQPSGRRQRASADQGRQRKPAERRSRLGLRGGAVHPQQLLLVARRQADRVSADEREGSAHLSHHRLDADSCDRRPGEVSSARRSESRSCVWA